MACYTNKYLLAMYHNLDGMCGSVLLDDPGPEQYIIRRDVIESVHVSHFIPFYIKFIKPLTFSTPNL